MISSFVFCSLNVVSLPRPPVNILAWHLKAFDNGKCGCTKLSQFTGNMRDLRAAWLLGNSEVSQAGKAATTWSFRAPVWYPFYV